MSKLLKWFKDIRKSQKRIVERNIRLVLKNLEKGETLGCYALLMEIRDYEREEALLSLIQQMVEEDLKDE